MEAEAPLLGFAEAMPLFYFNKPREGNQSQFLPLGLSGN